MKGRMGRKLTLPWLVSLEVRDLLCGADDTWGDNPPKKPGSKIIPYNTQEEKEQKKGNERGEGKGGGHKGQRKMMKTEKGIL